MSFDIPTSIEPEVQEYAQTRHLTVSEAIVELIRAGLGKENAAEAGLGLFGSPEDAAALDSAVALAYDERRQPSRRSSTL